MQLDLKQPTFASLKTCNLIDSSSSSSFPSKNSTAGTYIPGGGAMDFDTLDILDHKGQSRVVCCAMLAKTRMIIILVGTIKAI